MFLMTIRVTCFLFALVCKNVSILLREKIVIFTILQITVPAPRRVSPPPLEVAEGCSTQ